MYPKYKLPEWLKTGVEVRLHRVGGDVLTPVRVAYVHRTMIYLEGRGCYHFYSEVEPGCCRLRTLDDLERGMWNPYHEVLR